MRWCRGLFRYRDLGAGEQRGQGDRVSIGLDSPRRPGHVLSAGGVIGHGKTPWSAKRCRVNRLP